jgi:fumarate hydratase subunit beta
MKDIKTPFDRKELADLRAGEMVTISGVIYAARDDAHHRWMEALDKGEEMSFDPKDQCIYYVGPTPTKPGEIIGSCGPTSSYRMDPYTPRLLDMGMAGMIGKGRRSPEVIEAIKRNKAVYFTAIGGSAAKIKASIKECEVIDYEDLGTEAVRRMVVDHFPVTVTIDSLGHNVYEDGPKEYLESLKK